MSHRFPILFAAAAAVVAIVALVHESCQPSARNAGVNSHALWYAP